MLHKLMAGKEITDPTIVVRPTYVVSRQSTDILATEDRDVATALRFIQRRAKKERIQIDDVLQAVTLSRRGLYEQFARILGRSVHEEIKRVRVEELARMLVSISLSIS